MALGESRQRGNATNRRGPLALAFAASALLIGLLAPVAKAQTQSQTQAQIEPRTQRAQIELGGGILAAGEHAAYVRALEMLDSTRTVAWAIQPFTPSLEQRLARLSSAERDHPWAARFAAPDVSGSAGDASSAGGIGRARSALDRTRSLGGAEFRLLRPDAQLIYNSALPVGMNDGVLWAGRGTTLAAQGGFSARWKNVRLQFAPIIFRAQNQAFELAPNGQTGDGIYRDPRRPTSIDLPQRFGDDAYGRFDFGDSFIEAELFGIAAGFSNARISWGPARDHQLVHGVNAGGFPHVFVGTAAPLNIWLGDLHVRHIAGRLEQTEWSPITSGPLHRLHVGFVATFSPRLVPGLEIGGTRVMNTRWRDGMPELSQLLRPFQAVINDNVSEINQNEENQFASIFIRLSPPKSGFEAYAEYSREDFSGNWRWLAMQPDDLAGLTLGIAHARRTADGALHTLRGEFVNADLSHQERLGRTNVRPIPLYSHGQTRQGLTSRGQILGSAAAFGGVGGSLQWDRYSTAGRTALGIDRYVNLDWFVPLGPIGGVPNPEVRYGLRGEHTRLVGSGEYGIILAPSWTFNRNLERGRDLFNLNLQVRWRGW